MNRHITRGFDTEANLSASYLEHCEDDIFSDDDRLAGLPCKNEHAISLRRT